jgi:hypothetical protein
MLIFQRLSVARSCHSTGKMAPELALLSVTQLLRNSSVAASLSCVLAVARQRVITFSSYKGGASLIQHFAGNCRLRKSVLFCTCLRIDGADEGCDWIKTLISPRASIFFFSYLGQGETDSESTLYVGHYFVYYTSPGWWAWNSRWNENWQGKPKYLEKICPCATLCTTNPTCPDLRSNLGSWRLTAWAIARPLGYSNVMQNITLFIHVNSCSHSTGRASCTKEERFDNKFHLMEHPRLGGCAE